MPPRSQPRHELDIDKFVEEAFDELANMCVERTAEQETRCRWQWCPNPRIPRRVFEIFAEAKEMRTSHEETAWDLLMRFHKHMVPPLVYLALSYDFVDLARFFHRNSDMLLTHNVDVVVLANVFAHASPEVLDYLLCEVGIRLPAFEECPGHKHHNLPILQLDLMYGCRKSGCIRCLPPKRLDFQSLCSVWDMCWCVTNLPRFTYIHHDRELPAVVDAIAYLTNVHGYDWTRDSSRLVCCILDMYGVEIAYECYQKILDSHPECQTDPHRVMIVPRHLFFLPANNVVTLLTFPHLVVELGSDDDWSDDSMGDVGHECALGLVKVELCEGERRFGDEALLV